MRTATLNAATLETLVSAAVAAPSIHNTQPWHYRLDPYAPALAVRAATERGLRHADPEGRALLVSVGAAVLNLRVAIARHGWHPVVRLLPSPEDPALLATVRLAEAGRIGRPHRKELYEAIWHRHSSRFPFTEHPVPEDVRAELNEVAHSEGAGLRFPTSQEVSRLLAHTAEGERRDSQDADRRAETRYWGSSGGRLGLASAVLGPQDARGHVPVRDFTGARRPGALPSRAFERHPTLAVLSTQHDRRVDWLRAGQALEHVLLLATAHRLRASLLHQGLEWPDLRRALGGAGLPARHVQMLIRLGYGPPGPVSPRLTADTVLDGEAPEAG
ncbi:Acg family FMN-binding oxidoreductase [Streptomyces iconiensis]|uniref:Nitroreductase family protein n=1 Tax=Streptomyces iconiensis TaxID=1384038 RepID=A0ABT7A343_9ACTN|nr:nitroreductase family protein [Streptomyces iconiensis]MDJ1135489.1 nitroreductase family protein [Streptomyces iconiensis]